MKQLANVFAQFGQALQGKAQGMLQATAIYYRNLQQQIARTATEVAGQLDAEAAALQQEASELSVSRNRKLTQMQVRLILLGRLIV